MLPGLFVTRCSEVEALLENYDEVYFEWLELLLVVRAAPDSSASWLNFERWAKFIVMPSHPILSMFPEINRLHQRIFLCINDTVELLERLNIG
jgi:hypothetical protein